jgi:hypothetical protein
MSEGSRLGRESIETSFIMKQLVSAGVRVFFYMEDRERTLDSPTDKIMMSLAGFADEMGTRTSTSACPRRLLREGTRGTRGLVGRLTATTTWAEGQRTHKINADEGRGRRFGSIRCMRRATGIEPFAHTLNEQRVPTPRAQRGRPSGWDQGTIKAVLERGIYRGVIEYGKDEEGATTFGRKRIAARPSTDLVRTERPELRIVSHELAAAVDALRHEKHSSYLRMNDGKLLGRPALGRYLLSGLLRCPCGANFELRSPRGSWPTCVQPTVARVPRSAPTALALPVLEN